jgi:hypothetical protein
MMLLAFSDRCGIFMALKLNPWMKSRSGKLLISWLDPMERMR